MIRSALLPLLLLAVVTAHAQTSVKVRPAPDWIMAFDYPQSPKDTLGTGGYCYLISEWQEHAEKQEAYFRLAVKVLTPKGLSRASSVQVNFDPSYQQLIFHRLIIRRGNREINALSDAKFEILRREENMDRQVYDKSLDAMLNLEDVQVGDIVEYSYSVKGYNPVFGGKVIKNIRLNFGVPIAKSVDRLVYSSGRTVNYKRFNKAAEPVHETASGLDSYLWIAENLPAQKIEDNVPDWYRIYDAAEISEFGTWEEVNKWALPLYVQTPAHQQLINAKVEEIKSSNLTTERRIQAAIRFVQDEIRYLSFSGGIQGYRPHDPSVVLKQRFGDCKDKSLLLTTMLRQMGVTANPALVHSSAGQSLGESLPSPYTFDHCVTQFVYNDTTYWTDPTASLERGSFKKSHSAAYHKALVIAPGTTQLSEMKMPVEHSSVKVYETYSFNAVGGSAELTVKTIYSGSQANSIRSYYKSTDKEDIKQEYTNFYANEYPEIAMIDYVTYSDNEIENVIESREYYEIQNFWTRDSITGVQTTALYARVMSQYLDRPSTKMRKMPYALSHPVSVIHNITIEVPEYWPVKKSAVEIISPAFKFTSETDYLDQKIFLRHTYDSRKDHIIAGEAVKHVKDCDRAQNELSFQLTYTPPGGESTTAFNTPFLLIGIVVLVAVIVGLLWLYKFDPRSRDYAVSYEGFGGWLILPVIGISISPLLLFIELVKADGFLDYLHWEVLTNPAHSAYNPKLGILVLIEFIYQIALLAYSVFVVILMVKRRTSFYIFAAILYGANVVFILVDSIWLNALGLPTIFDGEDASVAVRTILLATIWIPYIIFSDRVKGTFTERIRS